MGLSLECLAQRKAVPFGHFCIQQDQVWRLAFNQFEGVSCPCGKPDLSVTRQHLVHQPDGIGVVVDQQDSRLLPEQVLGV